MTADFVALGLIVAVSMVLPIIIFAVTFIRNKEIRKGILISFVIGAIIGVLFQWFAKVQGLQWLFNNTELNKFMNEHYMMYLLLVSVAGALLAVIPEYLVVVLGYKSQINFKKTKMLGLGYAMAQAVTLVGARSLATIIELSKNSEQDLSSTTKELFMSSYERLMLIIIDVAIIVVFVYFILEKMPIKGLLAAIFLITFESFVPGFLIAFSTPKFLELYTRDTALLLVYAILTAMAISGLVIMAALKNPYDDILKKS